MTQSNMPANSLEWFAAWLPKSTREQVELGTGSGDFEGSSEFGEVSVEPNLERDTGIATARAALAEVRECLNDPSAEGLRRAIPHLEQAVGALGERRAGSTAREGPEFGEGSTSGGNREALRLLWRELALANQLFENAYAIQAGWARELGLTLEGKPEELQLYGHSGEHVPAKALSGDLWEG